MGKVTITIQSPQMPTATLYTAVLEFFPNELQFRKRLLEDYGFSPAAVTIFVAPSEKEEGG